MRRASAHSSISCTQWTPRKLVMIVPSKMTEHFFSSLEIYLFNANRRKCSNELFKSILGTAITKPTNENEKIMDEHKERMRQSYAEINDVDEFLNIWRIDHFPVKLIRRKSNKKSNREQSECKHCQNDFRLNLEKSRANGQLHFSYLSIWIWPICNFIVLCNWISLSFSSLTNSGFGFRRSNSIFFSLQFYYEWNSFWFYRSLALILTIELCIANEKVWKQNDIRCICLFISFVRFTVLNVRAYEIRKRLCDWTGGKGTFSSSKKKKTTKQLTIRKVNLLTIGSIRKLNRSEEMKRVRESTNRWSSNHNDTFFPPDNNCNRSTMTGIRRKRRRFKLKS